MTAQPPSYTDSPAVGGRPAFFIVVTVAITPVLASWRESLFAHEWLKPDGSLKAPDALSESLQARRYEIEKKWRTGQPLERPVLGFGILDTIEIGAGRDVLLTLAAAGVTRIEAHIPKTHIDDFKPFIIS